MSVKAQIVNLLQDLQRELGLALLFISHDLAIVEHMTHRVAVMYLGKIVEMADKRQIFAAPQASLHRGVALRRAGAEPGSGAQAHHPQGRRAEPDQSARRLPLPHPLPLRLRPLPQRRAGTAPDLQARPDVGLSPRYGAGLSPADRRALRTIDAAFANGRCPPIAGVGARDRVETCGVAKVRAAPASRCAASRPRRRRHIGDPS